MSRYKNLEIPERLNNYFCSMDGYDQPYFILLNFDAESEFAEELAQEAVLEEAEVYSRGSLIIDEDLVFLAIDCEKETIKAIAHNIVSFFEEEDIKVWVSVFCHNCLGEALETFKWCVYQLDEALEFSKNKSTILINDFTDKENWTGIEKYKKLEKKNSFVIRLLNILK